jgi:ABC-type lipoprotein export system ATPase subunit
MIDVGIRDLTIEYASGGYVVRPIHHLDLHVASGELALLLGASGSGKTTVLSALAAILRPAAGTIRVGDVDVIGLRGAALTEYRRHRVGVVFQTFNLVPSLTARDNVQAPLWAARMATRRARQRAEELLDRVGLRDRLAHRPGDLSGANSSAWPSPGPSPMTPRSCWPTSRPHTSTTSRSRGCCACSGSWPSRVGSWSWQPTTSACCHSPTGSCT